MQDDLSPIMSDLGDRIAGENGYQDKTVFITGASGFVGKVYIEKLLRTCPLVRKVYVLVRCKKNKDPYLRIEEMFNGPLFDLLKKERGEDILKKVVAIPGDIAEVGLGISQENREIILNEVQIIIHSAATVRFDEPLTKAVLINTRGTKFMLDLAKECKHLLIFSHVSTAYSHPEEKMLYDKAYPPPADPHSIIQIVESLGDVVNGIEDKILGVYPNTYAFTKALAEDLVFQEFDNLPVIILRPSVVIPIWKEPIVGWTDNINGPVGLLLAAGKGVLRTMYCDSKSYADYIPVDIFANALLTTTYDFLHNRERRIYNCTTSAEIKLTWQKIIDLGRKVNLEKIPFNNVVWYPGGSAKSSRLLNYICIILFHYLPAIIVDSMIFLTGNKPVLWKVQKRITQGFKVFEYYSNNQWHFDSTNFVKIRSVLTEDEKKNYKIDLEGLDLEEYFYNTGRGTRLYILNEPDSTIPSAKRHIKIMWAVDRVVRLLFWLGFAYVLYTHVLNPIFGFNTDFPISLED